MKTLRKLTPFKSFEERICYRTPSLVSTLQFFHAYLTFLLDTYLDSNTPIFREYHSYHTTLLLYDLILINCICSNCFWKRTHVKSPSVTLGFQKIILNCVGKLENPEFHLCTCCLQIVFRELYLRILPLVCFRF